MVRSLAGLAYDRGGSGPPLLLIHGLGSDRCAWDPVLAPLRDHYDVVSIDLPGHGQSSRLTPGADASAAGLASHVAHFLNDIGWGTVHVAGSSLGGWIGLELAQQSRARSVTAMAPAGFWRGGLIPIVAHANRWAARVASPAAGPLLRIAPLRAIGFWTSSANPVALDADLAAHATTTLANSSGWAAALAAIHGRRCDATRIPDSIPVTVVWGDRDRILPASHCQDPYGLPPHARWVRLSECGHIPMWDQPEQCLRLIDETTRATMPAARLA